MCEQEAWRTEITNYVDSFNPQLLKSAADRNTELLAQHSARMASMHTMIADLQTQLKIGNENADRNAQEMHGEGCCFLVFVQLFEK
eukprot:SAG31_NODE_3166_length_4601_cov_2.360729_6_plen_86_part_00